MSEENWNETKKEGAPPSGLFWTIPESAFGAGDEKTALDMVRNLRMAILAINASPYEKNAHIIEFVPQGNSAESLKVLQGLQTITSQKGMVLLVRDSLTLAAEAKADGVVFTKVEKAADARRAVGVDPIIAAHVSSVNDIVKEIDLAMFSEGCSVQDIAKAKISVECTVMSTLSLDNENCSDFVQAGCDFLNASKYMNAHKDGAAKAAVNMLYAIDLALEPSRAH